MFSVPLYSYFLQQAAAAAEQQKKSMTTTSAREDPVAATVVEAVYGDEDPVDTLILPDRPDQKRRELPIPPVSAEIYNIVLTIQAMFSVINLG